jgi:hypothetical protein
MLLLALPPSPRLASPRFCVPQRLTAEEVLRHPWTRGRTARRNSFCAALHPSVSPKRAPLKSGLPTAPLAI